jgi:hypothetical protein
MSKQAWIVVAVVVGSVALLGCCGCGGLLLWFLGQEHLPSTDPVAAPRQETKGDKTPWELVPVGRGKMAVPKGWRNLDNIKPGMILYRQGDGKGVPLVDETKSPLQIGLVVEKFSGAIKSVKDIMNGLVKEAQTAPQLELVGQPAVETMKLADGTDATFLTAEFIKEGRRRSLQMKLVTKDVDGNAWIASAHLVGGKESKWPTANSNLAKWLRAHLTSLCWDKSKVDVEALKAAYAERDKQ